MAFQAGAVIGKAVLDSADWEKGTENIEKSNDNISKGLGALAKGVAVAGAAIAAGLTAAVIKTEEFNKEFANVSTLVDPAVVDVGRMRKELLSLDSNLGSSTDLTKGLYQAISASVEPTKAVGFVAESAKFAKAALIDTNTAVDVITTGLNAYGLQAEDAGRISDVLFNTIKSGKTTGDELSATIGQVIPLAANMNLSFENLGASIAEMTKQGISSAESTTQLNAVMTALLKPSESLQTAMLDAGFATGEAVTSSDNFQAALQEIISQTDGSNEALAELFPNVRALQGALALTGDGAKGFTDTLNSMQNSAGATDEAFGKQEKTFATLQNSIEKIAIKIGDQLIPFVYDIVEGITDFIDSVQGNDAVIKGFQQTLAFLGSTFEVVKEIISEIVGTIFKGLKEEITEIADTLSDTNKEASASSQIFEVLGKAVDVVTGIIGGAIKIIGNMIKSLIEVGKIFGSIVDIAKLTFKELTKGFSDVAAKIVKFFKPIIDGINSIAKFLKGVAVEAFKSFGAAAEDAAKKVLPTSTVDEIKAKVGTIGDSLKTIADLQVNTASVVTSTVTSTFDTITTKGSETGTALEAIYTATNERIKQNFAETGEAIVTGNTETGAAAGDAYITAYSEAVESQEVSTTVESNIMLKIQGAVEAINTFFGTVTEKIKAVFDVIGEKLVQSVEGIVSGSINDFQAKIDELNNSLMDASEEGAGEYNAVILAQIEELEKAKEGAEEFNSIVNGVANSFDSFAAGDWVGGLITILFGIVEPLLESIGNILSGDLMEYFQQIQEILQTLGEQLGDNLSPLFEILLQIIITALEVLSPLLMIAGDLLELMLPLINILVNVVLFPIKALAAGLTLLAGAVEAVRKFFEPVTEFFNNIGKAINSFGSSLVSGAGDLFGFANGGVASGLSIVGEEGPEIVNFGSPSRVFTNQESMEMLGGEKIINMPINFTGEIKEENVDKVLAVAGQRLRQLARAI